MAEKQLRSEGPAVYVAKATFYYGGNQLVLAGHTIVAGHPMLKGRLALFDPFEPTWPLPTKASGPSFAEKMAAAKAAKAAAPEAAAHQDNTVKAVGPVDDSVGKPGHS